VISSIRRRRPRSRAPSRIISIPPSTSRAGSWASNRGKAKFTVVALDTDGKPIKAQAVGVRGRVSQVITTRKRLVGGFYAYDNRTEVKDLGALCSGSTDDKGLLSCEASLDSAGQAMTDYKVTGIPTTVIVGRDGKIKNVFIGYGPGSDKQIEDALEAALKESGPST